VGVGPSTASVVLNGSRSGTKVSEVTREAILKAAQELNYRPNGLARSFRKSRTNMVAFFSGYEYIDAKDLYIAEILSGLQQGCADRQLNLLLCSPYSGRTADEIMAILADGHLDGMVITARPEHPICSLLAGSHLPVVAIADKIPNLPSVTVDAADGGRLQARHLHERGHRRVLYVPSDYPFPSVLERQESFFTECRILGIEVIEGAAVSGHVDPLKAEVACRLVLKPDDLALLRRDQSLTAVQVWDDTPAYRIATQLADEGFQIPERIAVVGYNGSVSAIEPRWKLSTVRAPWREVGISAISVLQSLIEGTSIPMETVLPVHFVHGSTT